MWPNFLTSFAFGGSFLAAVYFILRSLTYELPRLKVVIATIGRDLRGGIRLLRMYMYLYTCFLRNLSVGKVFRSLVAAHPDKPCFLFENKVWTFQQVEDYSNQVANMFLEMGYQKGDEVALFMHNCPQFVSTWLGLSKVGIVPALINTNLKTQSLAHCINIISTKAIIFDADLANAVKDAAHLLKNNDCEFYCLGDPGDQCGTLPVKQFETLVGKVPKDLPEDYFHDIGFKDRLIYIYTSGTTGLPKAAVLRHSRCFTAGAAFKIIMGLRNEDVIYNTLPLYHSAGGMMYLSGSILFGNTTAIRKKFSASNFWLDAIKYKATVSLYIGEICRFLLSQPAGPLDRLHDIRMMCGNGLRSQIWREFQERFGIEKIVEMYGATEGTANIVNFMGKPGAVGFVSRTFSRVFPVNLIRVDPESKVPIRGKNGLCVRCKPGEPGVIVAKALNKTSIFTFDGYVDASETRKKLIDNCFEKGDQVFFSGDLLVMDENGYLYFLDRTGDTFRWRGENVSTNEVEMVVSKLLGLSTCVVYGVQIEGVEGRAGMAAIQSDKELNMDSFLSGLQSTLPFYAIPVFIRMCKEVEFTGTYKLKKVALQEEGFDVQKITDPIFFLDPSKRSYVPLNIGTYKKIMKGEIRL